MRELDKIIVHCAATPPDMDVTVKQVRGWHVIERGWSDIGYHYFIRRDGTLETGRPLERTGAHAKGFNKGSVGICFAGGVDENGKPEDNRTGEQSMTLRSLIDGLVATYGIETVIGHRDLPNVSKACPCFDVKGWYYD